MLLIADIKRAGNGAGLTDIEIGNLEVCEMHPDKKRLNPIDIKLELANIKHRGGSNYFIHYENKFKGIITGIGRM